MKAWLKKRKWWIGGGVVAVLVVILVVIRGREEEKPLEITVVEYTTVRDEVDVTGIVQPVERYELSFSTTGILKSLQVAEGEKVTAGQILARLDASGTAWQEAQAKAVMIGDLETAQLSLLEEQNDLADLKSLNLAKLEESKQTVRNTKASLDIAKEQWRRIEDGDTDETSVVYTAAEAAYTAALNAYSAAQDSLSVVKQTAEQTEAAAGSSVAAAQKSVQLKQDTVNSSGDPSVNKASLQYQRSLLAKAVMRAPADGIVARVAGDEGEYMSPTVPVITVVSPELQLSAHVPETEAARLTVGDSATVTFDALRDGESSARVSAIDSVETVIDGVTTYEVTLVFTEQDGRLRSGMTADVIVLAEEKENVLAIPQRAVSGERGDRFVQVVRNEIIENASVETGLRGSDGMVEVVRGLSEGDEVVTFDPNAEE